MSNERVLVVPEATERLSYQQIERVLTDPSARLIGPKGEVLDIPPKVRRAMQTLTHVLASEQAVLVTAMSLEFTTQQAADVLGISRPSFVRLLEQERSIPFHTVGRHRRVAVADLLAYRDRMSRDQRRHIDELTRLGEEMGGYDLPVADAQPVTVR